MDPDDDSCEPDEANEAATPDSVTQAPLLIEPISDPIGTARRRHGAAGAMLAAGMFGVDVALGRKPKEDAPVVVAASSEPTDIETDGIEIPVDEQTTVYAPPQPPSDPLPPRRHRRA